MDAQVRERFERIAAFEIDEPGTDFPFAARLARENAWSREYAQRVVDEYKKFTFLALAAGHPVTPSEQVDQAWHLQPTRTGTGSVPRRWASRCTTIRPRAARKSRRSSSSGTTGRSRATAGSFARSRRATSGPTPRRGSVRTSRIAA